MRDIPTLLWLLLTVVTTITHRWLPEPRWLMIHLLFLGAITHAILVWSQYFSFALLRSKAGKKDRRTQNIRLLVANGGAALVFLGVPLQIWALTIIGAAALVLAVLWHALSIYLRSRTSLPGKFGRTVRYYLASAILLAIGATIGAIIATGDAAPHLVLSHVLINVLGWVGITVAGTVVTLWPTILRTRVDDKAALWAARALPLLAVGVVLAAVSAILEILPALAISLVIYAAGFVLIALSLWRPATQKAPKSFAALSVGMALIWWIGCMVWLIISTIVAELDGSGFVAVLKVLDQIVPYFAAGFAAQVLVGALSYLIPVVLGGGPTPVRVGTTGFDRWGHFRITLANLMLAFTLFPLPSLTLVVATFLYLIAMALFLYLMLTSMRAQQKAKKVGASLQEKRTGPIEPEGARPQGLRAGGATAGLLIGALAIAISFAVDPSTLQDIKPPVDDPNAPVLTVQIEAKDMHFTPNRIEVPEGTRLVIELTNTDQTQTHDLVLANGVSSSRLSPGASETLNAGVITESLDGWCSIVGHRQMGMTLTIVAVDSSGKPITPDDNDTNGSDHDHNHSGTSPDKPDLMGEPSDLFRPYNAVLDPLPASTSPTVHKLTLVAQDRITEVAPGVTQTLWTYNDTAPGPTLHGKVGDTFEITLVNNTTMGHSIDFHAGALAPDEPMRTIAPGEQLLYKFTATRSGIWMYHCSTMPMSAHIANGMYGAVVIEPEDLPAVDRSYVLVQGEYYLGDFDAGIVDFDKVEAGTPDLVVFNGYANQYQHLPLTATVGERVRIWVLDAGIERPSSFHIVGGQFDTVWAEGRYLINRATNTGSQAMALQPAQGGFVELVFPEAGHYPFVSHLMIDAERGASGIFKVTD
ncbi:MAG: multicopper oxidase domain-containing protein [Microbacteriaceae bacterium]|nr:multicopper oxidase domain-containing protein [Microbacteriaceae bacterium]